MIINMIILLKQGATTVSNIEFEPWSYDGWTKWIG